jgi:hypothetical protein
VEGDTVEFAIENIVEDIIQEGGAHEGFIRGLAVDFQGTAVLLEFEFGHWKIGTEGNSTVAGHFIEIQLLGIVISLFLGGFSRPG